MKDLKLRPSNIIVVGGGSGIGKEVVQKLLDNGASNIIIASRNIEKLNKAKNEFIKNNDQNVYAIAFDITNIKEIRNFLNNAQNLLGNNVNLDGLVISSGVNCDGSNWKGFNISEENWDKVINTNLKGPFFLIREFSNFLYEKKLKGNICVISSISAHRDLLSPYQISKLSISRLVKTYGKYLCERGVVLNCVEPGPIYTDMMKHLEKYTDGVRPGEPWNDSSIRRLVRKDEIADIICFLMSNLGEVMSGTCILAGGGAKSIFSD